MSKKTPWEEAEEQKEILKEQEKDIIEFAKSKMDKKAEFLVVERRKQMERIEMEMEDKVENGGVYGTADHSKNEDDKRLAAEMIRLKREEVRDKKTKDLLRGSSEELKLLESKLRAGYVSKQLMAQMAEKEAAVAHDKLEKIKIQEMIEAEERCMGEQARLRENTEQASKYKYRDDLLNQIKEGNKKQQDKERDLILEKALLEQAMRKIREEDEREKEARMKKLTQIKKDMEEFQKQKAIRLENEKKSKEFLEKKLKEFEEEKKRQEEKRIQELKEKEALKEKIRDQITQAHLARMKVSQNREEILAELAEDHIRQEFLKKEKEKEEIAQKVKEDYLRFYEQHMEQKNKAWREDYVNQKLYSDQLAERIALQEQMDKSSSGNKEVRAKELNTVLQNQIREKHKLQIEGWQREAAQDKLRELEEIERMRIIEEERLRMLKNHAVNLIGYLPRGVLRENDLNHLGPEFLAKLDKHNAMNQCK